jgi:anti-sigma factor RsiW
MKDVVCMSGVELLMEYMEGALAPDVREAIERHVAGCPRCDAFIASYRETPRIVAAGRVEKRQEVEVTDVVSWKCYVLRTLDAVRACVRNAG